MSDIVQELQDEYCPPLDSALFTAIISDFELPSQVSAARETLDLLKAGASEQVDIDFDPSGNARGSPESGSSSVESTANGLSDLHMPDTGTQSEPSENGEEVDLDSLDPETKILLLQDVFPDLSEATISHVMQKCDRNWQRALDELLNQSYFLSTQNADGEDKIHTQGIEAFSEENLGRRTRKGRRNRKKNKSASDLRADALPTAHWQAQSPVNRWQSATADIEFIASRCNHTTSAVRAVYNDHQASVSATIAYYCKDIMRSESRITSNDASVQAHAVALGAQFPKIQADFLTALICLTHPSMTAAEELAGALTASKSSTGSGTITPQYERLSLSDDEYTQIHHRKKPTTANRLALETTPAAALAASHSEARRLAAAQAQAAYRKSRSNPLMGGVAGYYSQNAREHAAASQRYNASVADDLVASRATSSSIDLHGVDVQNAIRIASESVGDWWASMGESRANGRLGAADRASGFTIITGKGTHSQGGVGKLGPAVSKALTAEGWKVEPGSGNIVVRGRARR